MRFFLMGMLHLIFPTILDKRISFHIYRKKEVWNLYVL